MIINNLAKILPIRYLLNIVLIGLHGQTVSGYGFTTTFSFPKEKRKEFLDEILGGNKDE